MLETVKSIAGVVAEFSELIAVVVIVIGTLQAIATPLREFVRTRTNVDPLLVFRRFAGWLVLALEFMLAADILKSAISPTWSEIGQLAASRLDPDILELLARPRSSPYTRDKWVTAGAVRG